MKQLTWLLLPTVIICLKQTAMDVKSSLKKDHLVVVVSEFPVSVKILRNSTGHLIGLDGVAPLILDALSRLYNFDYSILDTNVTTIDGGPANKPPGLAGLINYALRGECDLIVATIAPLFGRLSSIELVHSWMYSQAAFLMPMPEILPDNVDAVIKPFQLWVWIGLAASSAAMIITLMGINRFLKIIPSSNRGENANGDDQQSAVIGVRENMYLYVVETLLNQGGYISCKIIPVRLVIGAWCLLTLVLVNVYNGVLISYVTAVHRELPLISSTEDIATKSNVYLVVDKGISADILLSAADKGLYKAIGDKFRSYPKSRCNTTKQCIDLVKSSPPRHVYFNSMVSLKAVVSANYRQNRQCKVTMFAENNNQAASWGLAKKSPHLENFNRGTLRLHETGLILMWRRQFESDAKPCWKGNNNYEDDKNSQKKLIRLSLSNLSGAFVVISVGWLVAVLTFSIEKFVFYRANI